MKYIFLTAFATHTCAANRAAGFARGQPISMGKHSRRRVPAFPLASWVLGLGLLLVSALVLVGGASTGTPPPRPDGWNSVSALVVQADALDSSRPWFWPGIPMSSVTVTYAVDGRFLEASYDRVGTTRVGDTYLLAVNPSDLRESVDSQGRELVLLVRGAGVAALVAGAFLVLRASRASRARNALRETNTVETTSTIETTSSGTSPSS